MEKLYKVIVAIVLCGFIFYMLEFVGWIASGNIDTSSEPPLVYTIVVAVLTVALFIWSLAKIFRKG